MKTRLLKLNPILALCAMLAFSSAGLIAQDQNAQQPADQNAPAQTTNGARTDGQIEMDVVQALDGSDALKNDMITAATIQGQVTLSGTVSADASRQLAESLAAKVPGVTKVKNNLKVGNPADDANAPPPPDPNAEPADNGAADNQAPPPAYGQNQPQQQANNHDYPQQQQQGYPQQQQGYPQQQQGYPQQQSNNQGYPQQQQQGYPQQQAGNYPQQQGYPQQQPGYPQQQPGYPPPPPGYGPGYPPPPPGYARQPYPQQQQQPAFATANEPMTVPQGTVLQVRTNESIDNKRAKEGATLDFTVIRDVAINGYLAIPRGATVHGVVSESKKAGELTGSPVLALRLTSLDLGGRNYPLDSDEFKIKGPSKTGHTVSNAVGGALLGAFIGGAAGGGGGAAIGAVAGGGVGTAASAAGPNPRAWIPAEALVTFHLNSPIVVDPVSQQEAMRLAQGLYPGGPALYRRGGYYGPRPYVYPPVYYRPYYISGGYYYWR